MKKSRLALMMFSALLGMPACSSQPVAPEINLRFNQTTVSVQVGKSVQLSVSGAGNNKLEWSSSNANVATVSATGEVTGVAAGSATVTVKVVEGEAKATCTIRVVEASQQFITEPTEILIKTTFNDTYGAIFQDAIEALEAKEPNLTIKYDKYSGSYTNLKDDIINGVPAGNYPDIAVAYPDSVADFIGANIQLDMQPFMDNEDYGWTEEEKEDFYEAYLEEGQNYSIPGTYSLPIAKSTEGMYYDSDKIIGLTLPGVNNGNALTEDYINNLTWEELFDVLCPALLKYRDEKLETEALKKAFLDTTTKTDWAIVGYDSDDNLFITLAEQYGYGYTSTNAQGEGSIDFVNDGMKGLMKKFNKATENHYFTTKGILNTNVNYYSNADQMLFSIGSTGGVGYQFSSDNPKNVKVARIPHAAGKEQKTIQQGPSIAFLSHNDENKALATWLFYKELTTVQSCIAWSTTTGYAPIRKSVAESDDFLDYSNPDNSDPKTADRLKAFNAGYQAEVSDTFFTSPVFKGSSEARTQVGGLLTACLKSTDLDANIDKLFNDAYNAVILKM